MCQVEFWQTADEQAQKVVVPRDFPGLPVIKNLLPMQGTWVQSLVRELRSHMPQG